MSRSILFCIYSILGLLSATPLRLGLACGNKPQERQNKIAPTFDLQLELEFKLTGRRKKSAFRGWILDTGAAGVNASTVELFREVIMDPPG
ncbi:hypothetical protein DFH07DRAFT_960693 [Mycena maculata]|uniref:Uncharacterized protein n=1 Tax=Mycena maculata TaxID=230809 RepID=A0AAD7J059_9AGAR|nr:hypothetical protein DFH07DRAFT_960693 [Mycena maculata]